MVSAQRVELAEQAQLVQQVPLVTRVSLEPRVLQELLETLDCREPLVQLVPQELREQLVQLAQ